MENSRKFATKVYWLCFLFIFGTRWRSWLRHCVTSQMVAGSIPYGFSGIFHWHNSSGRDTVLWLTALDKNDDREYFVGCKVVRFVGLTTLLPSCTDCLEICRNLMEPFTCCKMLRPTWPCSGIIFGVITFLFSLHDSPSGPRPPRCGGFTTTLIHTTLGWTPVHEWWVHRSCLCMSTYDTHRSQTSMSPAGFEPAIPASERSQTHALDRASTGTGKYSFKFYKKKWDLFVT